MQIKPISLRQANDFVLEHHRHHQPPQGGLWAIALMIEDRLVGVAIAGRPVNRFMQRAGMCEITRVCVLPGVPNGCSRLYGRVRRIAALMGYTNVITYTLSSESGASLVGAGYVRSAITSGGSWSSDARPRLDKHPMGPKIRWSASVTHG